MLLIEPSPGRRKEEDLRSALPNLTLLMHTMLLNMLVSIGETILPCQSKGGLGRPTEFEVGFHGSFMHFLLELDAVAGACCWMNPCRLTMLDHAMQ